MKDVLAMSLPSLVSHDDHIMLSDNHCLDSDGSFVVVGTPLADKTEKPISFLSPSPRVAQGGAAQGVRRNTITRIALSWNRLIDRQLQFPSSSLLFLLLISRSSLLRAQRPSMI